MPKRGHVGESAALPARNPTRAPLPRPIASPLRTESGRRRSIRVIALSSKPRRMPSTVSPIETSETVSTLPLVSRPESSTTKTISPILTRVCSSPNERAVCWANAATGKRRRATRTRRALRRFQTEPGETWTLDDSRGAALKSACHLAIASAVQRQSPDTSFEAWLRSVAAIRVPLRAPMYVDSRRNRRLDAICSRQCSVQPRRVLQQTRV